MNKRQLQLLFLFGCLCHSCDTNRFYEKNLRIPDGIWNRNEPVTFEVPVEDTVSAYNLYINVRNTSMYPMRNLYLFVRTAAPSGHSLLDTVEVILADEKGKWYGSGLGDIWDYSQIYKEHVRFAQKGTYTFTYEQAMRIENLPFLLDVGLRIERISNQ